jgi:hypothetical protein
MCWRKERDSQTDTVFFFSTFFFQLASFSVFPARPFLLSKFYLLLYRAPRFPSILYLLLTDTK